MDEPEVVGHAHSGPDRVEEHRDEHDRDEELAAALTEMARSARECRSEVYTRYM